MELDVSTVAEVFHVKNGDIRIVVAPRRLEATQQGATQQIALLVCAGREGAGIEEWTLVEVIRQAAKEKGKLDSKNFAAHIKGMERQLNSMGSGVKRKVTLSREGWKQAKELVNALGGGEA